MADYQSEFTHFLSEMKSRHPDWQEGQRQGRRLLWDKQVDFAELQAFADASVMPNPYRYDAALGK